MHNFDLSTKEGVALAMQEIKSWNNNSITRIIEPTQKATQLISGVGCGQCLIYWTERKICMQSKH
jgi:hypothetical protein